MSGEEDTGRKAAELSVARHPPDELPERERRPSQPDGIPKADALTILHHLEGIAGGFRGGRQTLGRGSQTGVEDLVGLVREIADQDEEITVARADIVVWRDAALGQVLAQAGQVVEMVGETDHTNIVLGVGCR